MDVDSLEWEQRLYAFLLHETHKVAERMRARLAHLHERFPDLPPEILAELAVRIDPPRGGNGPGGPPHGGANPR